ncbi:type II secretion system F family protein [Pseudonocardia bannensis]|uniref:Type II secretion system F family protein n=1 Tax=Pseudonocardia bannensis TaxID=630973 RepID=A0A848DMT6_9PSEU|nr:type II secretion system F family protein [Pseudonocardia bannensis]NMH94087.1 type II secretion system F family protein [Pseudonocardia bannensis]
MIASELLLGTGLGAVFLAVTLGVAALVTARDERVRASRATALVARFGATSGSPGDALEPFSTRVVRPLWRGAVRLARTLSGGGAVTALARRLELAGSPAGWSVERVLAGKGGGLLGLGLLGAMIGSSSPLRMVVTGAIGAAAGFFLPDVLLYNLGLKRQQQIQKALPDTVDLLVISIQAGLGFDAALAQVTRNTNGPLAGEFHRVLQEMQIGKSRREAFQALADRVSAPDVRHFVGAVVQADALGVPISGVLAEQASEMRTRRRQRAEEQAQKVPVKILFPLMFFILPALFIVILGPAALQIVKIF